MSLTEIPATHLRIVLEFNMKDTNGLELLRTIQGTYHWFNLVTKVSALTEAPLTEGAPPTQAEDWSKLVTPKLSIESGRITNILQRESGLVVVLDRFSKKLREDERNLGEIIRSQVAALTETPPTLTAPPRIFTDPAATQEAMRGQERPLASPEPAPSQPPPEPPAPESHAEALVMGTHAADATPKLPTGKTVPVSPQPARATPPTLSERLIAYLRDLKTKGQAMPGNRDMADVLGISVKQFSVLLTNLRAKEAVDYEWRPDPTPDDQSLQRRFVTKA
jgi:hypothetical protein